MPDAPRQVVADVIISDESPRSQVLPCMPVKPVHLSIEARKVERYVLII